VRAPRAPRGNSLGARRLLSVAGKGVTQREAEHRGQAAAIRAVVSGVGVCCHLILLFAWAIRTFPKPKLGIPGHGGSLVRTTRTSRDLQVVRIERTDRKP
jgi:hypothetical protein